MYTNQSDSIPSACGGMQHLKYSCARPLTLALVTLQAGGWGDEIPQTGSNWSSDQARGDAYERRANIGIAKVGRKEAAAIRRLLPLNTCRVLGHHQLATYMLGNHQLLQHSSAASHMPSSNTACA